MTTAERTNRALADDLCDHLLPNNPRGGTYDPGTRSLPSFNDEQTYLVSVPGFEFRLFGIPSARKLRSWVKRVKKTLAKKHHYLGWWRDGSEWVFDISVALNGSEEFVLSIAESWGQRAVYHPASKQVVHAAYQLGQAA